jgi:uncharacterized protein (DUF488 family)
MPTPQPSANCSDIATIWSHMRKKSTRAGHGVISVGYGGRRIGDFISLLVDYEVRVLVDVRLSARSRVPGFAGPSLARRLNEAGIAYRHEPQLGNPEDNREAIRGGDPMGRARFRTLLANRGAAALRGLLADAAEGTVAVLCAERSELRCHRKVVIDAIRELDPALPVTAIG